MRSAGIEVADRLSIDHIKESVINLREVRDARNAGKNNGMVLDFEEKHAQALITLALKVKTRKY
jgi:hypothetical protein